MIQVGLPQEVVDLILLIIRRTLRGLPRRGPGDTEACVDLQVRFALLGFPCFVPCFFICWPLCKGAKTLSEFIPRSMFWLVQNIVANLYPDCCELLQQWRFPIFSGAVSGAPLRTGANRQAQARTDRRKQTGASATSGFSWAPLVQNFQKVRTNRPTNLHRPFTTIDP